MVFASRRRASTSVRSIIRPRICSRPPLLSRAYATPTTTEDIDAPASSQLPETAPLDSEMHVSPPLSPPPSASEPETSSSLPQEWAEQVQERRRRQILLDIFTPVGSSQNRESTFQAFHSASRPISPTELTLSALMAAGAHMGHAKQRTRPSFLPYIYGERAGMSIIDLDHTLPLFRRAANFVRMVSQGGGTILFVGTHVDAVKRTARKAAERVGKNAYHISDKWLPGTFTNAATFLAEDIKEGDYLPDVAIFLNPIKNLGALRECHVAMVPTVGIIDSDADPRIVTYPIPANDESLRTIELVAGVLSVAAREGRKLAQTAKEEDEGRRSVRRQIERAVDTNKL